MRNNHWVEDSTGKLYEPSDKVHGIVYLIRDLEANRFYVGKKQVHTKKALGKRELAKIEKLDGRKKYTKRVETNWRNYPSSNKVLKQRIKDSGNLKNKHFEFKVLHECYDETALKFKELETIILTHAFSSKWGYNDNIQIKQIGEVKDLIGRYTEL